MICRRIRKLLQQPRVNKGRGVSDEVLQEMRVSSRGVLRDFGVRGGDPADSTGPVVTLYELEPAPGIKASRVIGLADDIARSMTRSRCASRWCPAVNAIGIRAPNAKREMVDLRELSDRRIINREGFELALAFGKTIGGRSVYRRPLEKKCRIC